MFITILVYHSKTPDTTLLAQVGPPIENQALTFICGCFSFCVSELIRNFDFLIPAFHIFLATSSSASLRLSRFLQRIHIRTGRCSATPTILRGVLRLPIITSSNIIEPSPRLATARLHMGCRGYHVPRLIFRLVRLRKNFYSDFRHLADFVVGFGTICHC